MEKLDMTLEQLAEWYRDFVQRRRAADRNPACYGDESPCCDTHRKLREEMNRMEATAAELHPPWEDVDVLSKTWWESLGMNKPLPERS